MWTTKECGRGWEEGGGGEKGKREGGPCGGVAPAAAKLTGCSGVNELRHGRSCEKLCVLGDQVGVWGCGVG